MEHDNKIFAVKKIAGNWPPINMKIACNNISSLKNKIYKKNYLLFLMFRSLAKLMKGEKLWSCDYKHQSGIVFYSLGYTQTHLKYIFFFLKNSFDEFSYVSYEFLWFEKLYTLSMT